MSGILIVDDMPVIRSAVAQMLSAEEASLFSPILEATNGEEAVNIARAQQPEVILMDIKMPGLTGLQATGLIRQAQPNIRIVMLTAYNEFSYVQKALKLGARDYLLKPVRPEKLLALLAEIKEEIHAEQRERRTVQMVKDSLQKTLPVIETNLVENIVRGSNPEGTTIDESLAYLGKRLVRPVVTVIKVDAFTRYAGRVDSETLQKDHAGLVSFIRGLMPETQRAIVGYSNPGRVVAIVSTEPTLATSAHLIAFANRMRDAIAAAFPFTVTIGLGTPYEEISSLPLSYAQANLARRLHGGGLGNQVVCIDDLTGEIPTENGPSQYLVQNERELVTLVQQNQQQEAQRLINETVDFLTQRYATRPEAMKNHCAELVTLVAWAVIGAGADEPTVLNVLHQQVRALSTWNTGPEVRAWTLNSLAEMMALRHGLTPSDDAVQVAIAYMRDNYHRSDLSLNEVAGAVSLSQSHFSSQFKARMGVSYVKYLTSLRLDEAKRLLLTADNSVAQVSEQVGYPNPTNFYRHFRRDTGTTPAAFRETHGG